jgi:hypothetical protein
MKSRGPHMLAEHAGVFRTRVGAAFPGERAVFRGHDLHRDLKDLGWFELYALGVTGRRMPLPQLRLIEKMFVWTSYPDARLWNNRVAALAGSTRSTPNLALSAAESVSEATIYGQRNAFRALDFFLKAHQAVLAGCTLDGYLDKHLARGGRLAGYGRPLSSSNKDERMPLTIELAQQLGLADGPHVKLAYDMDRYFEARGRPLRMNFGGLISAFCADFGLSPRELNLLIFPLFLAGMSPCYLEAADKPLGASFAMPCDAVQYSGHGKRPWPRGE